MQAATIGILGLGLVGRALATRLQGCGHALAGCDLSPDARATAAAMGIRVEDSAAALADSCDVVLICVLDDAALVSCAASLAAAPGKAKLVLSCVTASVGATLRAATLLATATTVFADMPLLGSSRQIAQGEALGLLGMDAAVERTHTVLLADLCPKYRRVGSPGHGVRAKLACNLVLGLNRAALAEGLALASSLGLDEGNFLELLRESPAWSRAVDVAGPRMVARDFAPLSRIRQHRKDLALILEQGQDAGLDLTLTAAHARLLDKAINQGLGEMDNVAIIAAILPGTPSSEETTTP